MKSTYENTETEKKSFPRLMIHTFAKHIVLFNEPSKGTIINSKNYPERIGRYKSDWIMGNFKDLPAGAKVVLEND